MQAKLCGNWKLVGCKLFTEKLIEIPDPFHDASGIIQYTSDGLVSVQIMRNYPKDQFINNIQNLMESDFKDLFHNYLAYYGSYTIDEKAQTVTHNIEGAQWPQMVGKSFIRSFEFINNFNTVILSNTEFEAIGSQHLVKRYLTWNRLK